MKRFFGPIASLRLWTVFGAVFALGGCVLSSPGPLDHRDVPALSGDAGVQLEQAEHPRPPSEVLRVNEQMRVFARNSVRNATNDDQRMKGLTTAVLHPGSLGLRYSDRMTRTAEETFDTASGNCLSLSMLFVAMAREVGIEAAFYEVNVLPEWTLAGDIVFSTRHVNVSGKLAYGSTYVMDFAPYRARREIGRRRLTDQQAIAQYYNNIGAEFLAENDIASAYLHFRRGIELAPRIGFLWSNLSVAYSRNGQNDAAELALQQAIAIDSSNTSAMSNLVRIYNLTGRKADAEALTARIANTQKKNPYYQFVMGERDIADARYDDALKRLESAIRLQPHEPIFYLRAADAAAGLDRVELQNQYVARAEALRPNESTLSGPPRKSDF
ncbi:MAG: tetratricopeptide repeat protein [Woeseiaceae bacterium]